MKRSRRVVLTLMGSAAAGAVSMGFVRRPYDCGPGMTAIPGTGGQPYCRSATYGGFGGTLHRFHGHGGPGGHGGHGGG
jgi:hypothetical protein